MKQAKLLTKIRNWPSRKNRSRNPFQKRNRRGKKIPRKSPLGKSWLKKTDKKKGALECEVKREREIAERERENENSAGLLPEMSFQTVLSLVGIAFTAFELYQRFRQKESSGGGINVENNSVQSPISPREEPKHSEAQSLAERSETPRSAVSPKFGMV